MKKVREFLSQISWRKILTFSFFLMLATIFWLMQVYRQPFETTLTFPIKYTHVPDSIVFKDKFPEKLTVGIRDDGAAMFKYFFTRQHDSLEINMTKLITNADARVLQGSAFDQIIKQHLFANSKLIDYSPLSISFRYDVLKSKRVLVIFDNQINLPSGYLLSGDIQIIPDSVTVYGSSSALNKISYAYTTNDTVDHYNAKSLLTFNLKSEPNVRFKPVKIQVEIPIEEFTQKNLSVPIECENVPHNMNVKFFPSNAKLTFSVGVSKYKLVNESDFQIKLDYNELIKLKSMTTPLKLVVKPDYIRNLKIDPAEVEFIFEQK